MTHSEIAVASTTLRVRRLSGAIGAEVSGVDLRSDDENIWTEIRRLLRDHQVLFFPKQILDGDQFAGAAEHLGELAVHPLRALIGRPRTVSIIEDTPSRPPAGFPWHTDLSWLEAPPRFGFLHAMDIPDYGGDTLWASLTGAYRALSPTMQKVCGELAGLHRIDSSFRASVVANHGDRVAAELERAHPPVVHPLVRRHPDTGEASLWLSPLYVERITDLLPTESELLLHHLNHLVEDPNLSVRWHWTEGDVAIWDESCTVHRALADHRSLYRRMRRCTTVGARVEKFHQR